MCRWVVGGDICDGNTCPFLRTCCASEEQRQVRTGNGKVRRVANICDVWLGWSVEPFTSQRTTLEASNLCRESIRTFWVKAPLPDARRMHIMLCHLQSDVAAQVLAEASASTCQTHTTLLCSFLDSLQRLADQGGHGYLGWCAGEQGGVGHATARLSGLQSARRLSQAVEQGNA